MKSSLLLSLTASARRLAFIGAGVAAAGLLGGYYYNRYMLRALPSSEDSSDVVDPHREGEIVINDVKEDFSSVSVACAKTKPYLLERFHRTFRWFVLFGRSPTSEEGDEEEVFKQISCDQIVAKGVATRMHAALVSLLDEITLQCEDKESEVFSRRFFALFSAILSLLQYAEKHQCSLLLQLFARVIRQPTAKSTITYLEGLITQLPFIDMQAEKVFADSLSIAILHEQFSGEFVSVMLAKRVDEVFSKNTSPARDLLLSTEYTQQTVGVLLSSGIATRIVDLLCVELLLTSSVIAEGVLMFVRKISRTVQGNPDNSKLLSLLLAETVPAVIERLSEIEAESLVKSDSALELVKLLSDKIDTITDTFLLTSILELFVALGLSSTLSSEHEVIVVHSATANTYVQSLRWLHKQRKISAASSGVNTSIALSSLFVRILGSVVEKTEAVKDSVTLKSCFEGLLEQADESERQFIVGNLAVLLSNFIFMKELYFSMLSSQAAALSFQRFKRVLYQPGGVYDVALAGAQLGVVLGGCQAVCSTIARQWITDSASSSASEGNYKLFLTSDLAFLLEMIENEMAWVNVVSQCSKQGEVSSSRGAAQLSEQVRRVVVSYLLAKDSAVMEDIVSAVAERLYGVENEAATAMLGEVAEESEGGKWQLKREVREQAKHGSCYVFRRDKELLFQLEKKVAEEEEAANGDRRADSSELVRQVRKEMLLNVSLHLAFHQVFVERAEIFLERLFMVSEMLVHIYDVIEECLNEGSSNQGKQRITSTPLKSLLLHFVFGGVVQERCREIEELQIESYYLSAVKRVRTKQSSVKTLIMTIYKDVPIDDIID